MEVTNPQIVYDSYVRYIQKSLPITLKSTDIKFKFSIKTYFDLTVGIFLLSSTNIHIYLHFTRHTLTTYTNFRYMYSPEDKFPMNTNNAFISIVYKTKFRHTINSGPQNIIYRFISTKLLLNICSFSFISI